MDALPLTKVHAMQKIEPILGTETLHTHSNIHYLIIRTHLEAKWRKIKLQLSVPQQEREADGNHTKCTHSYMEDV